MISATILSADEAGINNKDISKNALKVINSLQEAGYKAYLVGGCVRDLLLNMKPKDFDVSTDATPEQIKKTIRGSRIIGRRFRLVHVRFGYEVIEVATFRANANDRDKVASHEMSEGDQGQLLRDNVYGTIEEDVVRRDFKVNALYYDPVSGDILDFMDSMTDIQNKQLSSIGDPKERFREDPVRMLRVIRFAGKLGFEMEPEAIEMIKEEGSLLSHVSSARLFDEVLKLFHGGAAYETYQLLRKYGLFKYLFPFTDQCVIDNEDGMPERALQNTDRRVGQGKPVIPAFLFACMMWDPVREDAQGLMQDGTPESQAWRIAMNDGLRDQNQYVAVPRRLAEIIMDIWDIHFRLIKRNPRMIKTSLNNRRFRAAYDFLLLRSSLHEVDEDIAQWWTAIQDAESEEKEEMIQVLGEAYKSQRQNRHNDDGEANGNSINYNSSEPNYNRAKPTQSRRASGGRNSNSRGRNTNNGGRGSSDGRNAGNGSNRRGANSTTGRGTNNRNRSGQRSSSGLRGRRRTQGGGQGREANGNTDNRGNGHGNSFVGNGHSTNGGSSNPSSNNPSSNNPSSNNPSSNNPSSNNRNRQNNRGASYRTEQHSAGGYYADAKPKNEYGHYQTSADDSNQKKVKVRHKRKIVGKKSDADETPHF